MKRFLAYLPALALMTVLLSGCGTDESDDADATGTGGGSESSTTGGESASSNKIEESTPTAAGTPSAAIKLAPEEGDDVAIFNTDQGEIVVMFHPERAPQHVANFIELASAGFYDGTRFHRVMDGFMIQSGDPNSKDLSASGRWGTGGNIVNGREVNVPAEFNITDHVRGVLSMARGQGVNTASSQFYIVHDDSSFLNGNYTAFGAVVSGMEVVDKIVSVTQVTDGNGTVVPSTAVVVKSISVATWPLD